MAALIPFPGFCSGAYQQTFARTVLSVDQAINCYLHRNELGTGKGAPGLINRPGYALFSTPAVSGVGRQLWAGEERLFAVIGSKFIEIDSVGVQTDRGSIGSGNGICTIASNTNQLMVVNPNTDTLYVDNGAGIVAPTTPPAAGARMGFFLAGRGYVVAPNTNTVFQSATQLTTGFMDWNPLEQATFLTAQDRIVATIADHDGAWLIGSATSQYLQVAGVAGFNLQPNRSAFVEIGTCAPYSPAIANGLVCMVSGSRRGYGQVIAIRPGSWKRLSNYAVEQSLRGVSDWGTVTGSGYSSQGHEFYILDVPDLNLQWVYDFTENSWHQRRGWNGSAYTAMLGRFTQCTFNNNYYVISPTDGKIYKQVDDLLATDAGVNFRCQRTAPVLFQNKLTNINRFRLDMQYGTGSTTDGAYMRISYDGGLNYSTYSYETMGRNGEANVLEWAQLGQAGIRGAVFDVYWDKGVFAVAGASVDATSGLA